MKGQFAILPPLPILGSVRLSSPDGLSLSRLEVIPDQPCTKISGIFKDCFEQLNLYLHGNSSGFDLPVNLLSATSFQMDVLNIIKTIPYGETVFYKDIANTLKSKAFQAIGNACHRNPLLLIYPCHRVVGANGMGGFVHGIEMKSKLLNLEKKISINSNRY
jgi:O-6-methylguanine DNA methyltransferase